MSERIIMKGTPILSRDGTETGHATGGTRSCYEGCPGYKFGVRWPDGKLTWVCTTDVVAHKDGYRLITRQENAL